MANDVLKQLSALEWKGIGAPFSSFRSELRHDLVQHKYPDRDGAHVEATGRAPLQFSAKMPFLNGIELGKGPRETWIFPLFPNAFTAFLNVAQERSSGVLNHPDLGAFRCKLESLTWEFTAGTRDGVIADAQWVETTENQSTLADNIAARSPVTQIETSAADLDTINKNKALLKDVLPLPEYSESFTDFARAIKAGFDQSTIYSNRLTGMLDTLAYRADAIITAASSSHDARAWPAIEAASRMLSAVHDVKREIAKSNRATLLYKTPKETTLADLSIATGAPIGDLATLNPALLAAPTIAKGTTVRYYSK